MNDQNTQENDPFEAPSPLPVDIIDENGFSEHGTGMQLAQLYKALAKAMGEFAPIERTRTVKVQTRDGRSYSFDYAEMDEINRGIGPALSVNGLALITPFSRAEATGSATHHLILSHEAGARLKVSYAFQAGHDVKELGGQTTYQMRYLVSKAMRLHAEGDADDQPTGRNETSAEASPRQPNRGPNREPPKMPPQAPKAQAKAPEPPPRDDSDPGPAGTPAAVVAAAVHPEVPETRVVLDAEADRPKPTTLVELKKQIKAALAAGVTMDDLRAMGMRVTGKSGAEIQKSESASQAFLAALGER